MPNPTPSDPLDTLIDEAWKAMVDDLHGYDVEARASTYALLRQDMRAAYDLGMKVGTAESRLLSEAMQQVAEDRQAMTMHTVAAMLMEQLGLMQVELDLSKAATVFSRYTFEMRMKGGALDKCDFILTKRLIQ